MNLFNEDKLNVRDYQEKISNSALEKNTLVVIPTGMGKTLISILISTKTLEKFPNSKILITAPTRPLNDQHKKNFEKFTKINKNEIVLVTGKIPPKERESIYKKSKIIIATPQTIENDLQNEKLNLKEFSFITFDEAHRAVKDYSYSYIAKKFMIQSKNPLILGLTASPGGTKDKINEICNNLFIKSVEVRTDLDLEKYVKKNEKNYIKVEFPKEFEKIRDIFKYILNDNISWLKDKHYIHTKIPGKKILIAVQNEMSRKYTETKNFIYILPLMRSIEAIKISHAIELIETQGISVLKEYIKKIQKSSKKTDEKMMKNTHFIEAIELINKLDEEKLDHPKFDKLIEIIKEILVENSKSKIIIFANFRYTVEKIKKYLEKEKILTDVLIGQSMKNGNGMSQKKQIETLNKFRNGDFNVLCGTSVSEEGIDIPSVDYAIFYETVPSEIRSIQRRGRVGRQSFGKTIFLITKDTRDETYLFASNKKEKEMYNILKKIQENKKLNKKKTLIDWIK